MGLTELLSQQGCIPFRSLRGEPVSLPFPDPGGSYVPWLRASSFTSKDGNIRPHLLHSGYDSSTSLFHI